MIFLRRCKSLYSYGLSFGDLPDCYYIENRIYKRFPKDYIQQVFELSRSNMKELCDACEWKWNDKKESRDA